MKPINQTVEVLLIALALAGMFCAIPNNLAPASSSAVEKQSVLMADGTDPMPLCRRCR